MTGQHTGYLWNIETQNPGSENKLPRSGGSGWKIRGKDPKRHLTRLVFDLVPSARSKLARLASLHIRRPIQRG